MQRLVIELDDKGQLNINGPIQNKVLCLGMLELAKSLVIDFKAEDLPKVVVSPVVDIDLLRRKN